MENVTDEFGRCLTMNFAIYKGPLVLLRVVRFVESVYLEDRKGECWVTYVHSLCGSAATTLASSCYPV
jgi:hypothetical protein